MAIDKVIVEEFLAESKDLIKGLLELLENVECDFTRVQDLATYGNNVDRIMGGAKNLALMVEGEHALHMIADYAALCKAVGYKGSQLEGNEKLFDICVALLLDATENLEILLDRIHDPVADLRKVIPNAFIDRLRWVDKQFSDEYSQSVGAGDPGEKLGQSEIDDLLKSLGF
jgi:hypothetical protein